MEVKLLAIQPGDVDKSWLVEYAARACHASALGDPELRFKFLGHLAAQGHLSVFEHARFLRLTPVFDVCGVDEEREAAYGGYLHSYNARHLIERNPAADLRSLFYGAPQVEYHALTPAQRLRHACATFEISGVSRVETHQQVRHRTASYSQESERHVMPDLDLAIMPPAIAECEAARYIFRDTIAVIQDAVAQLLHLGIHLEDVRYIYPHAAPTRFVVTARFYRWAHFLELRTAEGAQWEIRAVAEAVRDILHATDGEVF